MSLRYFAIAAALLFAPSVSLGQLRVVAYNTLDKPVDETASAQVRTIFEAIASTSRNGIAKRPDVIALQEQRTVGPGDSTASRIAAELNDLFGVTSYQTSISGSGNDLIAAVYDSATVTLGAASSVFTGGPRATRRYEFQPVGYTSDDATFYQYSSHLKAGTSDASTRATEGERIRANTDALGAGANAILGGDFNFYSQNEAGYVNLTNAGGTGRAFDPLSLSSWPHSGVAEHLTQSTRTSSLSDGGATGGLDDRFDLQLITDSLLDGEGLTYLGPTSTGLSGLEHSYQAFGNDGNTYNTRINATFVGRSQSSAVINALHAFSDHLPVVADYQLPAVLGVEVDPVPMTVALGEAFSLDVAVANAAAVVAAAGADELDYTLSTSGDLSGAFSGTLEALAADTLHEVLFDTSTLGMRSGILTVSTSSEAAANALFELPISYEVIAPLLAGDYNDDGIVDAADYTAWRDGSTLLNETVTPGFVTEEDYTVWQDNYGSASAALVAVPEPTIVWMLAVLGVGVIANRR